MIISKAQHSPPRIWAAKLWLVGHWKSGLQRKAGGKEGGKMGNIVWREDRAENHGWQGDGTQDGSISITMSLSPATRMVPVFRNSLQFKMFWCLFPRTRIPLFWTLCAERWTVLWSKLLTLEGAKKNVSIWKFALLFALYSKQGNT